MYTKVRGYKDTELLNKVKSLNSFTHIPNGYWLLGVRSDENSYDIYDDKIYLFKGESFIDVATATTNSGGKGFKNYWRWNSKGVGEIKSNECYYDVWKLGKHNGKMDALKQVGGFKIIRKKTHTDTNKEWFLEFWKGFNFHCNTYNVWSAVKLWTIGGWSVGCQVVNDRKKYFKIWIPKFKKAKQEKYTYILLDEF